MVLLSDSEDKYVMDAAALTNCETVFDARLFPMPVRGAGKKVLHLHFFCPAYIGLDFTVSTTLCVRPESEKPKVMINPKDLELDKKKGLMDVCGAGSNKTRC